MLILGCYTIVLTVTAMAAYMIASVAAHHLIGLHGIAIVCPHCWDEEGDGCELCDWTGVYSDDDADDAWDRAHDQWVDREAGLWW